MKFVFVRHGKKDGKQGKNGPLTKQGRDQARAAGEYLKSRGITPDWVCHTPTRRTKETAVGVVQVFGVDCAVRPPQAWGIGKKKDGEKTREAIEREINEIVAEAPHKSEVTMFVGHHSQQGPLRTHFGFPKIPEDNRGCVLVLERKEDGTWQADGYMPGSEATLP